MNRLSPDQVVAHRQSLLRAQVSLFEPIQSCSREIRSRQFPGFMQVSEDASSLKCTILALLRKSSCDSFFEFRAHFFALVDYKNTAFGATDRPTYFLNEAQYPCSAAWLPINPIVVRIWSFVSVHEHHCAFDALLILA